MIATDFETALGRSLIRAAAANGLLVCRVDGIVESCNPAAALFLGCAPKDVVGRNLEDALSRLDEASAQRFHDARLRETTSEFIVPRPGADDQWTEVRCLSTPDGAAFLFKDVTERERCQRDLRSNERKLISANDSLRITHKLVRGASWEWIPSHGLRWLDPGAARQLIGLPPTQMKDKPVADWRELIVQADRGVLAQGVEQMRRSGEATYEFRVHGVDGQEHWLRGHAAVVERDTHGAPARVSGATLDVTETKAAEETLKREIAERLRIEQHQELLLHELNHRVKNILATVQAIARQTFGRRGPGQPIAEFEDRLLALAATHDVLTEENWVSASLGEVLKRTLSPLRDSEDRRIRLHGPDVQVSPRLAVALAMAVHELATNAVKYGALSNDRGVVAVRWRVTRRDGRRRLFMTWREQGGPPVVTPHAKGFGSRLIEHGLRRDVGAEVSLRFKPSGVICHLDTALDSDIVEHVLVASAETSVSADPSGGGIARKPRS